MFTFTVRPDLRILWVPLALLTSSCALVPQRQAAPSQEDAQIRQMEFSACCEDQARIALELPGGEVYTGLVSFNRQGAAATNTLLGSRGGRLVCALKAAGMHPAGTEGECTAADGQRYTVAPIRRWQAALGYLWVPSPPGDADCPRPDGDWQPRKPFWL